MNMAQTVKTPVAALPALHPVKTLMEEHRFILNSVRELGALVDRLAAARSFAEMGADREVLKGIAHHLVDAESHHDREEEVLFPRMAAHGVTELPARMKAEHTEFRLRKRRLFQLAQADGSEDFPAFKGEVREIGRYLVRELSAHIAREDEEVYERALDVLDPAEWDEVKRGCDAIGYCCFKPADQAGGAGAAAAPAVDLDFRGKPHGTRLLTIMKAWEGLGAGQTLRISNDTKPDPLRILFQTKEKGRHEWLYEVDGPEYWVVLVKKL